MSAFGWLTLTLLAQARAVVVLSAADPQWESFEQRMVAELQASGLAATLATAQLEVPGDIPAQLWEQCRARQALAVLWLQPKANGQVDAWVVEQVTGKAMVRTYAQPASGPERARLALRVVELLHASLLELQKLPPQVQEEFPELGKLAAAREFFRPHFTFGTGLGAVFTAGLRPQPLLELQLGYAFSRRWAVEGQAVTSVFPTRVEDPQRRFGADVGVAFLRAVAVFYALRGTTWGVGVLAGTGAALLWATGDSVLQGIEVRTEARGTWWVGSGLQASLEVSPGIRVQLLAQVGVTLPEVGLQLAGTVHAWIGRPVIDALLRLEFQ